MEYQGTTFPVPCSGEWIQVHSQNNSQRNFPLNYFPGNLRGFASYISGKIGAGICTQRKPALMNFFRSVTGLKKISKLSLT